MKKTNTICPLLLFFLCLVSIAGNTEEITSISKLYKYYIDKNQYDSAIQILNKPVLFNNNTDENKYLALRYHLLGLTYSKIAEYDSAINNYQKALEFRLLIKDSVGAGVTSNNLANCYFQSSQYELAIKYFQLALDIFERIHKTSGTISSLNGCGLVYENLSNYAKAIEYYIRALAMTDSSVYKKLKADILNNLGNVNSKDKKNEVAYSFYLKSYEIRKELNDWGGMASSMNNIGIAQKKMKHYTKALEYFYKALEINQKNGDVYEMALNFNAIGKTYFELENYQKSLEYINRSFEIATSIESIDLQQQNLASLADVYAASNQFQKAYSSHKKSILLRDSIENLEIRKKINELQTKYETSKKENEIQVLKKENVIQQLKLNRNKILIVSIIILATISLFIGILIFKQKKLKIENQTIMLEQKLLRAQMNPHFIFNSLASIQSFIFDHDKMLAGKYISDFAALMRLILENSREEFITLDKEIATLTYYLELQKLRYEDKFDYTIEIDPQLITDMVKLPPMLGQPFVENSIKHGFLNKAEKGLLNINFTLNSDKLAFEIKDNGIGRAKADELKKTQDFKHVSLAQSITKERIDIWNTRNKKKITFKIDDLMDNQQVCGTIVQFSIPII